MRNNVLTASLTAALITGLVACGPSVPPPVEARAAAEGDVGVAAGLNAKSDNEAATYLKHAEDQIAEAKKLMEDGDNVRATAVLKRAKADAELSIQLAKEAALKGQMAATPAK